MNITRYLALSAILFSIIAISGCGSSGRAISYARESAPAATASQIVVRVTEIERTPSSITLRLAITNPTSDPVVFGRSYGVFTAATLVHGSESFTGVRVAKQPRNSSSHQYAVFAQQDAHLSLQFYAPGIGSVTDLSLTVRGSTHGVDQTWTIAIPPEPSLPTASNP